MDFMFTVSRGGLKATPSALPCPGLNPSWSVSPCLPCFWIRRGSVGSCVMRAVMLGWSFGGRHLVGGLVDGGFEGEVLWVAADEFRCTAVMVSRRGIERIKNGMVGNSIILLP